MRSNPKFSPRLLVAVCWSVLAVLFSIPALAHPVYLTGENYTWHFDALDNSIDNWVTPASTAFQEVFPEYSWDYSFEGSADLSFEAIELSVAGSYESQQHSSEDTFSFSATSSVSAEGRMGSAELPRDYVEYEARMSQKFYYLEFLVTEQVLFTGNLSLTDAFYLQDTLWAEQYRPVFGDAGTTYLSGSILDPGTYRYWSGLPTSHNAGFAFDGFASVSGGAYSASSSSFTQFINMQFTAVAVPTPSALALSLGAFGMMLFARSRRFRNRRGDVQLVSES